VVAGALLVGLGVIAATVIFMTLNAEPAEPLFNDPSDLQNNQAFQAVVIIASAAALSCGGGYIAMSVLGHFTMPTRRWPARWIGFGTGIASTVVVTAMVVALLALVTSKLQS